MTAWLDAALLLCTACAPQDPPPQPWQTAGLDRAIEWTRDPEPFVDGRRAKRGLTLRVDRDAILDGAVARAAAEGKLVLWYVPRVVESTSRGMQMYRAPVLDVYMQQVVFEDPDVAAIVGEHFVPVRLVCDEALAKRFGLRPLEFGEPAVVFVDGTGEIVHVVERIRTFDALWFARLLGRVLDEAGIEVPAEHAVRAGQYERALAAARDDYQRATLLRRLARPDEALEVLERVLPATGAALTERGLILTLAGRTADALAALADAAELDGVRQAEALYLLGVNRIRQGDHAGARGAFAAAVARAPDTPWGRRARANLETGEDERPLGASFCGFESFGYLVPDAYRGLPRDTSWPGDPQSREQLVARAVEFLLAQQRDDGGFTDSRYAYWPSPEITTNAWVAITSLAASALLAWREHDPERIDAAVARAERFAFDPKNLARGKNEDVYADAYRLLFLVHRHARLDPGAAEERRALVARMNALLAEAHRRQTRSGLFAHEYPNAFCTAALLWSAHRAREAGAELPLELVSNAVQGLLGARTADGAFVYSGSARGRRARHSDSSARMPLCEATLLAFGHSDPERLEFAFETFWKYMDRIERVRRNDFHSDGELAGFFFFHALFHTSEVKHLLDDDRRAETDQRLLELLQRIPELDGSFVDSHELGRSYGTAMALLVLANL